MGITGEQGAQSTEDRLQTLLTLMTLGEEKTELVRGIVYLVAIDQGIEAIDEVFEALREICMEKVHLVNDEEIYEELLLIQSNLPQLHIHGNTTSLTVSILDMLQADDTAANMQMTYAGKRAMKEIDQVRGRYTIDEFIQDLLQEYKEQHEGDSLCDNDKAILTNLNESINKIKERETKLKNDE